MEPCRIAIVGATGAVGQVCLRVLEERDFPYSEIRLCASKRSVGKKLKVKGKEIEVEEATPQLFHEVDIAFISASSAVSRELAPIAVENGALVIDDSSVFRMDPNVPLVVPEVNADDLAHHRGIVAIPNCSTTPLVMVLKPLHQVNLVKRVIADTYQSVSGTGAAAVEELRQQSRQVLEEWGQGPGTRDQGRSTPTPDPRSLTPVVYPHPIAFNALPHIEPFLENGYTREEMKMLNETRKIMHDDSIAVSATCVRVPVVLSHSEAVHIEFTHPITPEEVRQVLSGFPGIKVLDEPQSNVYPMPVDAAGKDDVFVGRIRQDISVADGRGIAMWIVSDNLRKGAATNAIQIAEEILSSELLLAPGRRV